jgi:plastocyanin
LLFGIAIAGFSTTHTITNSGTTFSPATITISTGDSVRFNLGGTHNSVEVSQTTWNANGTTPLPGFSLPFGGGLLLPAQLTPGTHYYVCVPHAEFGMKGTIIVQSTTGVNDISSKTDVSIFPNPSNGVFQLEINSSQSSQNYELSVYDISGATVLTTLLSNDKNKHSIDLSEFPKGIYFIRVYNEAEFFTKRIVVK